MGILDPKALRDWIKSRAVNNLMATAKGFFLDARLGPVIQNMYDRLKGEVDEINGNLSNFENLVLSDAAVTINNLSALDNYKTDGIHTVFIQTTGEPFVEGGLYLLEVKTQTFTVRQSGCIQTMTRIFPVTDATPAAIVIMRTLYNSYKGNWITMC